ncbi:MAG: glutamate--tRNA ligase [Bacteroidota bacterium]|nr:glutamate--tRNA ligase [Bacteroidota bacterium]
MKVRVRFAPSPTGPLHIGGVRTALYNYLFAKKNNGEFILRIEDTDQTRYVPGAEKYIIESLEWLNIKFDEGVHIGGSYGPYRQSERKHIYKQYAEKLVKEGHAYYAFDTPEELEAMREKLKNAGSSSQQYDSQTRGNMKNSLTLPADEVKKRIESGVHYVIRIKIPENTEVQVYDKIRGLVTVQTSILDDKVLFKSDGMPTYHLANVVDDYLMKITHVIRGEEWLPSAPLHVLLYRFLGWEKEMPEFAHLPLLLKPDGKGKLSKRDGDKLGFPVFPLNWNDPTTGELSSGYRESGYFPEAVVNILAFLGWNSGTEQEIFSMDELINLFSMEKVGKSGSKFDVNKAKWFNHQYLVAKDNLTLAELYKPFLQEKGINADINYIAEVCNTLKSRVNFAKEFWEQGPYFFIAPEEYDKTAVKKRWKEKSPEIMEMLASEFEKLNLFDLTTVEECFKEFLEKNNFSNSDVLAPLRLVLTGLAQGPSVFEIMSVLGKNKTIARMRNYKSITIS